MGTRFFLWLIAAFDLHDLFFFFGIRFLLGFRGVFTGHEASSFQISPLGDSRTAFRSGKEG